MRIRNLFLSVATVALCCGGNLLIAPYATAGEVRISLPELNGLYELTDFSLSSPDVMPPRRRSTRVDTGFDLERIRQFSIEIVGLLTFGEVVGDGMVREAVRAPLRSTLSPFVTFGENQVVWVGDLYAAEAPQEGPLYRLLTFQTSWDSFPPVLIEPPITGRFNPLITLSPTFGMLTDIPYLVAPPSPIIIPDTTGLMITLPWRAEVTSATLILEGATIPEPSSVSLCALVTTLLVGTSRAFTHVGVLLPCASFLLELVRPGGLGRSLSAARQAACHESAMASSTRGSRHFRPPRHVHSSNKNEFSIGR